MELRDRKRKVDTEKLTPEQADEVAKALGDKVRHFCDEAVEKANAILSIYGLKAKMAFVIEPLEAKEDEQNNLKQEG